ANPIAAYQTCTSFISTPTNSGLPAQGELSYAQSSLGKSKGQCPKSATHCTSVTVKPGYFPWQVPSDHVLPKSDPGPRTGAAVPLDAASPTLAAFKPVSTWHSSLLSGCRPSGLTSLTKRADNRRLPQGYVCHFSREVQCVYFPPPFYNFSSNFGRRTCHGPDYAALYLGFET